MKPTLAWSDLLHLSSTGQDIIGQMLADAIEAGFDDWKKAGGTSRPVPAAPGPVVVAPAPTPAPAPAPGPAPVKATP